MLFSWIRKYSYLVYALAVITTVAALLGAQKLSVTPDNRVFYGPSNPYFQDFLEFESNYTANNNILFVISSDDPISQPEKLRAVQWLTDQAWRITNVIRVDSVASYPIAEGSEDTLKVITLADTICPDGESCEGGSLEKLKKPQIVNRLISPDLRSTGVVATIALKLGVLNVIEQITSETQELADEFRSRFPDMELVVTGAYP